MKLVGLFLVGWAALAAGPGFAASPLAFKGAELGMTMEAWRSLSAPAGAGPQAKPICSDDARLAGDAASPLRAADKPADDVVVCSYGDVYGQDVLLRSIQLDPAYRALDVRYLFARGRLTEIQFDASIDAYDDVMNLLTKSYGPPTATIRDSIRSSIGRLERVRQAWRTPGGTIRLDDPSPTLTGMIVRFVAPEGADGGQAVAARGSTSPG